MGGSTRQSGGWADCLLAIVGRIGRVLQGYVVRGALTGSLGWCCSRLARGQVGDSVLLAVGGCEGSEYADPVLDQVGADFEVVVPAGVSDVGCREPGQWLAYGFALREAQGGGVVVDAAGEDQRGGSHVGELVVVDGSPQHGCWLAAAGDSVGERAGESRCAGVGRQSGGLLRRQDRVGGGAE